MTVWESLVGPYLEDLELEDFALSWSRIIIWGLLGELSREVAIMDETIKRGSSEPIPDSDPFNSSPMEFLSYGGLPPFLGLGGVFYTFLQDIWAF